jgi:riboflavin kinase/FMN adenylyltransferase
MQIHKYSNALPIFKSTVVTVGSFDGLHVGHLSIINKLIEVAKSKQLESVVLTFNPHPRSFLQPNNTIVNLLQTDSEKETMLAKLGVDHLIIIPFDAEFANLSAADYIHDFLIKKLSMKAIVIGHDHSFGKNKEGTTTLLMQKSVNNFEVYDIAPRYQASNIVSSTKIRNALEIGDLKTAKLMLIRDYSLQGHVVHGDKLGNTIGFATANLRLEINHKQLPKHGVYLVKIAKNNFINVSLFGLCNIGMRPTVGGLELRIEVHILDFNQTIYDLWMDIEFLERIRDEHKFESLADLQSQIKLDVINAKNRIAVL